MKSHQIELMVLTAHEGNLKMKIQKAGMEVNTELKRATLPPRERNLNFLDNILE